MWPIAGRPKDLPENRDRPDKPLKVHTWWSFVEAESLYLLLKAALDMLRERLERWIRNAPDRARLRQANRLFEKTNGPLDAATLSTLREQDLRANRVFQGGLDVDRVGAEGATG